MPGELPFDGDFRSQARAVEERLDITVDQHHEGVGAEDALVVDLMLKSGRAGVDDGVRRGVVAGKAERHIEERQRQDGNQGEDEPRAS